MGYISALVHLSFLKWRISYRQGKGNNTCPQCLVPAPEHNSLCCSERRLLMIAVVSYSINNLTSRVCVCAGWGQVVEGQGEIFFFFVVIGKARGDTPLFGLYGYVPLNRVWFSGS